LHLTQCPLNVCLNRPYCGDRLNVSCALCFQIWPPLLHVNWHLTRPIFANKKAQFTHCNEK
jgi:hypothetical protein